MGTNPGLVVLNCNPHLGDDNRKILSSSHPPLHSEFEVILDYLKPNLLAPPTLAHPYPYPTSTPTSSSTHNKKQMPPKKRKLKTKVWESFLWSLYKISSLSSPQKQVTKGGNLYKRKRPHWLLMAPKMPHLICILYIFLVLFRPLWNTLAVRKPGTKNQGFQERRFFTSTGVS